MLSKPSWLPLAEKLDLPEGRSRRVNHDCGDGRTLKLSREGDKLTAYCFRCNDNGSHKVEEPLAVRIARLTASRAADADAAGKVAVPDGLRDPSEWPREARLWLARAGLHSGDIGALGARYDPSTRRVVVPCGEAFWIGRAVFPGQTPKYLAPSVGRALTLPQFGQADRITLTEDILSAYKVGQVAEAWSMLGTSPSPKLIAAVLASGKPVNVWLDNDLPPVHKVNRGQMAARRVVKLLNSYGISVRNVVTPRDPKLMTYAEIKELTA